MSSQWMQGVHDAFPGALWPAAKIHEKLRQCIGVRQEPTAVDVVPHHSLSFLLRVALSYRILPYQDTFGRQAVTSTQPHTYRAADWVGVTEFEQKWSIKAARCRLTDVSRLGLDNRFCVDSVAEQDVTRGLSYMSGFR